MMTQDLTALAQVPPPVLPPPLPPPLPIRREPSIEFFAIDSRKIRRAEWFRSTGKATAVIGWLLGRIGLNITGGQRVPRVNHWRELEIPRAEVPADVESKFAPQLAELSQLGFGEPVFFHLVNRFNGYEDYGALLSSPTRDAIGRVFWSRALAGGIIRECFEVEIESFWPDGSAVFTRNLAPRFDLPPSVLVQFRAGAPLAELWHWHRARLAERAGSGAPRELLTADDLWNAYDAGEQADFAHHQSRGLFVRPDESGQKRDAQLLEAERTAAAGGSRHAAAWAELDRLQTSKSSTLSGLIILVATLALSLSIGSDRWTFEKALLIMGILFVHELGHYLTMRWFGYRELRMFFIPLLGAAVTGRNYNVPGWKKATVSLMGPLPGIFLGAALGIAAAVASNDWLAHLSMLTIIINAVNLLPVLPLDGGWFWNAIVFCRHPRLELIFKIFAGLAAIGATIGGLGKFWMYLGIATFMGLPIVSTQAQIVHSLRRKGAESSSIDGDTIPHQLGEEIFDELSVLMKGRLSAKAMASSALQIFERLNARPPGAAASIGLAVLYFASLFAALIGMAFAGYAIFGDLTFKDRDVNPLAPTKVHLQD